MALNWLRHSRARDLFFIFIGFFGLIVIASIISTKITRDKEQKKALQAQTPVNLRLAASYALSKR